jgi:hypothetical protein
MPFSWSFATLFTFKALNAGEALQALQNENEKAALLYHSYACNAESVFMLPKLLFFLLRFDDLMRPAFAIARSPLGPLGLPVSASPESGIP